LRTLERHRWSVVALLCGATVLALTYWRLYYGVDFTDEAFYVAVPYRFTHGARPFVDEATLSTFGLLTWPAIWLHDAVAGVDGVVLFERKLSFLFSCAVAACVFLGVRPYVRSRTPAFLCSLLSVAFVPFSIPNLSYNTLGSGLFVAGCFLGLRFLATRRPLFAALAGLVHGLAVVAYPTILVPAFFYGGVVARMSRGHDRRFVALYALAGLVPLALLAATVVRAGIGNVADVYSEVGRIGGQGGGAAKGWTVTRDLIRIMFRDPFGVLLTVVVVALRHRARSVMPLLLAIAPLLFLPLDFDRPSGALRYVSIFGMFGLVLFAIDRDATLRPVFVAVWPAALVAGLVTAYTSGNGADAFGLGFAPAAIVTAALLTAAVDRTGEAINPELAAGCMVFAGVGVLAVLTLMQFAYVYRDGSFSRLDTRIAGGPYAGMYTTPARRRFVATMTSDLRRLSPSGCRILFYDEFPAGYLLSNSRSYTDAVFLFDVRSGRPAYRRRLLDYYRAHGGLPDVAVRMTEVPGVGRPAYVRADPLDRLLRQGDRYRVGVERRGYTIYLRRGGACLERRRA
jgi:hypothetical protein